MRPCILLFFMVDNQYDAMSEIGELHLLVSHKDFAK